MIYPLFSRLWTIVVCVGVGTIIAGCQGMQVSATATVLAATPTATTLPAQSSIETEVADVKIAMNVPKGWRSQQARYGVLLVEKTDYNHPGGKLSGMQIYVFVRSVSDFNVAVGTNNNTAWTLLNHIVSKPDYIGDAAVRGPSGFTWKGHDAAYYLLNDSHSNLSLVLAMIMSQPERLVVFNVSCPQERAKDIRLALPELLMGLTLNDMTIDPSLLEALPDPLDFPVYEQAILPGGK